MYYKHSTEIERFILKMRTDDFKIKYEKRDETETRYCSCKPEDRVFTIAYFRDFNARLEIIAIRDQC